MLYFCRVSNFIVLGSNLGLHFHEDWRIKF